MKRAIIKKLFVVTISILTPLVGQAVMLGYDKLPDVVKALVDPWAATTFAVGVVSGTLAWGLAKWQGIPVELLQEWLSEKGLYAGRKDGDLGIKTVRAIEHAINEPTVRAATLTSKFKRPQGGKIP